MTPRLSGINRCMGWRWAAIAGKMEVPKTSSAAENEYYATHRNNATLANGQHNERSLRLMLSSAAAPKRMEML
jgi:hypothetical protein